VSKNLENMVVKSNKGKGLFGSRVLEGRRGEIFNLKCLVQFLEGEGRGANIFKI